MRTDHPAEDEIRANFEEMLASVRGGGGLRTDTGLDNETELALWAIARAFPEVPEELVTAARTEFAAQLDGSHRRARREALARMSEELDRKATQ
ncbi:hypothetical protein ACFVAV_19760 [Nocardia sp. NPDC057663]|uniref:hypothetical protein n=1 Tax=Nocardia sp. NPDC057663 TaxID=3346201 RepID=UPI00366B5955